MQDDRFQLIKDGAPLADDVIEHTECEERKA